MNSFGLKLLSPFSSLQLGPNSDARAVKIYNDTSSLVRLGRKQNFICFYKRYSQLPTYNAGVVVEIQKL
jgi:hypothetical protein